MHNDTYIICKYFKICPYLVSFFEGRLLKDLAKVGYQFGAAAAEGKSGMQMK